VVVVIRVVVFLLEILVLVFEEFPLREFVEISVEFPVGVLGEFLGVISFSSVTFFFFEGVSSVTTTEFFEISAEFPFAGLGNFLGVISRSSVIFCFF